MRLTTVPTDVGTAVGSDVRVQCAAAGRPAPRVTWRRLLSDSAAHVVAQSSDSATLTIASIRKTDAGEYECVAANDMEPAIAKRITVTVNGTCGLRLESPSIGSEEREPQSLVTDHSFGSTSLFLPAGLFLSAD